MKNIKFSRLFAAFAFVAVLALTACQNQPSSSTYPIYGKWVDSYDSYNTYETYDCSIESDKVETASYGAHSGEVVVEEINEDSGYIYYQFEKNITGYTGTYPYMTEIEVEAKGKWGAIAYIKLQDDKVLMCDVYDPAYDFPEDLEKCKAKYTIDAGYFSNMVEFKRVTE